MRLEARPVATLSVDAQERHERRERFYSNDLCRIKGATKGPATSHGLV